MSPLDASSGSAPGRGFALVLGVAAVTASLVLAACGDDDGGSEGSGSELIVFALPLQCGTNDYTNQLCDGVKSAAEAVSDDYEIQIKSGTDYTDSVAFNNLIQTSLQLDPAGLIVLPNGPAAQTPVLNKACDQGVEVIVIDTPAESVECQASFIGADHEHLGQLVGEWLVENDAPSKEVGVVTFEPGDYVSIDNRVKGFTETVEPAGYEIVATATSDLELANTRTAVQNMLTAHPDIGTIFTATSPHGQGASQALKDKDSIVQLTVDGALTDVPRILDGTIDAESAQAPFQYGSLSVEYMADVLQGETVPETKYTEDALLTKSNVKEFEEAGGLR